MFLAVDESLRREGYGSAILKEIRNRYPEKKLIVSIEPCEDISPDTGNKEKTQSVLRAERI